MKFWLAFALLPFGLLAQGVDAIFVLETTPGTEQAIGLLRTRDLKETDRAGVIGFSKSAQVLQNLTADREATAKALRQAGTRVAVGLGGAVPGNFTTTVDIGSAIKLACRQFELEDPHGRTRAVIVLFANEDPSLTMNLDSTESALRRAEARLFGVAIQRAPAPDASNRRDLSSYPFPAITAQIFSQLSNDSGGKLFRRNWNLKDILAEARKPRVQ